MTRPLGLLGIFLVLLASLAPVAGRPAKPRAEDAEPLPRADLEAVERAITATMAEQGIPGLSVALVTGNRLCYAAGYGLADVENYVPAKASTVYRWASIAKPVTATAVMQLAQQGKLDLDKPVQAYCPGFPRKPWPVTPRHLLGHVSGIRNFRDNAEGRSKQHYNTLREALDLFKDDPLEHEPSARMTYSTYGYNLLGCAVEGASGMAFADYLQKHIFTPAGMRRARVDDAFAIIPNRAQGYTQEGGELRNAEFTDTSNRIPAGGLCSTAEDLARFAIALQRGVLVNRDTLKAMWTSQKTRDGKATGYGLGWHLAERKGRKEVLHGGVQPRVTNVLYLLPEQGVAVVLLSNLQGADKLPELARQIADLLLAHV
jgi:CubicO group peptidase (beta-lactamase class C family)